MIKHVLHWLKWKIAGGELEELDRWRIWCIEYRRWLAEFDDISDALDSLEAVARGRHYSMMPTPEGPWGVSALRTVLRRRKPSQGGAVVNTKLLRVIASSDGDEDVARAIFSAAEELDRLNSEVSSLNSQLQWANSECTRARLDERQAMTYLSQVRIAAEHDGDFPSLVEHVKKMAEALRAAHEMTMAAWIEGSNSGWKAARSEE